MKVFAQLDPAGLPVTIGQNREVPEGAIELPPGVTFAAAHGMMRQDGDWVKRPMLAEPEVIQSEDGLRVTFSDLPDTAEATVIDFETGAILGVLVPEEGDISFTLADSGQYSIEVRALPALDWSGVLSC